MLKLIAQRFFFYTPAFFKKLRATGAAIFLGAMAVKTGNDQFALDLAPVVIVVCNYAMAIGIALAGTAQLTTTDNKLSQQ